MAAEARFSFLDEPPALLSEPWSSFGAFCSSAAGFFLLLGGAKGFEDDCRRWWPGWLAGCWWLLSAARSVRAGAADKEAAERATLPTAGENMAGCGACGGGGGRGGDGVRGASVSRACGSSPRTAVTCRYFPDPLAARTGRASDVESHAGCIETTWA